MHVQRLTPNTSIRTDRLMGHMLRDHAGQILPEAFVDFTQDPGAKTIGGDRLTARWPDGATKSVWRIDLLPRLDELARVEEHAQGGDNEAFIMLGLEILKDWYKVRQ